MSKDKKERKEERKKMEIENDKRFCQKKET